MNDEQKRALVYLAAIFPQAIVGEAGMAAWAHALRDIPAETLAGVADAWIRNESKPPTIADIRADADALSTHDTDVALRGLENMVMNGEFRDRTKMGGPVRPRGFTGNPALEDAVAEAGGWTALAAMDTQELEWAKKKFIKAFKDAKKVNDARMHIALNADGREELTDGGE
jgi:hypothetical protein